MRIGIIVAAGKQSRFNSDTPKALCKYKDKTLVEYNIDVLSKVCEKVYVIVSDNNVDKFKEVLPEENICNIHISGLGSGDAIFRTLDILNLWINDDIFICWGDTILSSKIFNETDKLFFNSTILIPATWEDNPYVLLDGNNVRFSKYGDIIEPGYHDLSIFIGNAYSVQSYCLAFRKKFFKEDKYNHKHGSEFEFLDIFNDTDAKYKIVDMKDYKDMSFNTVEELDKLSLHV